VALEARPEAAWLTDIAQSLDAFAELRAAAFHDRKAAVDVYVLRGPGAPCDPPGPVVGMIYDALGIGAPARTPRESSSLAIRLGTQRVFVRHVERASRPALLIVAGEVRYAGLARLQVERAAARIKEA
jgi:hypothetical protein